MPKNDLYPRLLSPLAIRGLELRNRIVFQPHFTALGTIDGRPTSDHIAYHEERAAGGVGLIVFESQAVHPAGKMSRRFLNAWDPEIVPLYRELTDCVHAHGARIFGQLTHAGHTSLERPPHLMWAPTQMPEPSTNFTTKAMDLDDIAATISGFAQAASNAKEGGFDGVEVKIAHDGLLRSFASPFFNRRADAYGGTFEKRMRLPLEVVETIKAATGDDFIVGVRLCLHEYTPWGYGLDYGLRMAERLEMSKCVDYFNCDAGSFSSLWMEIPPFAIAEGSFRALNAALKRTSDLPVVAFGRIKKPGLAEDILASDEADLIGMARQLIADPEWSNKVSAGRESEIRYCIGCNDACTYQTAQEKPIRCVQNPAAGREVMLSERRLVPADSSRRVIIVGAGPAGLKLAETVARRGHTAIVFEREAGVGGQVRLASKQPLHAEIWEVVAYLEDAASRLGVDLRVGVQPDEAAIMDLRPDVIVVATGSEPNLPARSSMASGAHASLSLRLGFQVIPNTPGLELPHVFSVDAVLRGEALPGRRVLVVDESGHWEAVGTAEFLNQNGFDVEVISSRTTVGADIEPTSLPLFFRRAARGGIRLSPNTRLSAVEAGSVVVADTHSGIKRSIEVDAVVAAIGRRSCDELFHRLRGRLDGSVKLTRVGDCVAPRRLESVISEAYQLGCEL